MRGFIVLCLAAVAVAAPQGYNYNPAPQQSTGFGSNFLSSSSSSTGFVNQAPIGQPVFQQAAPVHQVAQHSQQAQQQQAIVSKRFFIHTAPEDAEEEFKERHITVGVPKKNYNVVFIKSPASSHKKTAIKISPAVNEEKTVIYVLNKKSDSSDVHAEVIEQTAPTSKPEVFFIKYKTNEEAQHAQREIQAQYDSLGGSSQVSDEGVAPVTSVIGSLGDAHSVQSTGNVQQLTSVNSVNTVNSGFASHGSSAAVGATGNAYLPPNF